MGAYASKGAYSNPEGYVDTQTSRSFEKLQDTINSVVTNMGVTYANKREKLEKELKANNEKLEQNNLAAIKAGIDINTEVDKIQGENPGVDFHATFGPFVDEYVDLNKQLLNGTAADTQYAMKRIAQIKNSTKGVTESLGYLGVAGETYTKAVAVGIGVQGGLARSQDPNIATAMNVLTSKIKGTKEAYYADNDPTKLMWRINWDGAEKPVELSAAQLKAMAEGRGEDLITTVLDHSSYDKSIRESSPSLYATETKGDKSVATDRISDAFLMAETSEKRAPGEGTYNTDGSYRIEKVLSKKVNKEAIKNDTGFTTLMGVKAESILANPISAAAFYNDIMMRPGGDDGGKAAKELYKDTLDWDGKSPLNEEQKKLFKQNYIDWYVGTKIPNEQQVQKADSSVATNTYVYKNKAEANKVDKSEENRKKKAQVKKNAFLAAKKRGGIVVGNPDYYYNSAGQLYYKDEEVPESEVF